MSSALDLSIVIPAFNEARRLPPVLRALHAWLAADGRSFEILVVDDGSTDATRETIERAFANAPEVRVLGGATNLGKGHAVRIGMLAARGAVRVLFDADGSTPPSELPMILDPLTRGAAIAIGSRYIGRASPHGQPWWRKIWSRGCNALVHRSLVPGIVDPFCGFKAFSADAATRLFTNARVDGWAMDLEVLALAIRDGMRIVEVPVEWRNDPRSRVRPIRDFVRVVAETWTIRQQLRTHALCP